MNTLLIKNLMPVVLLSILVLPPASCKKKESVQFTPVQKAIISGDNSELDALLRGGYCGTSSVSNHISPPIFLAIDENNHEAIKLLLNHGVNIHQAEERYGYYPIHRAALQRRYDIFKILVHHGANVNIKAMDGRTALMYACSNGDKNICSFIIDSGADVNIADNNGRNALFFCITSGNNDCIDLLVKSKIYINAVDTIGYTPLVHAIVLGHNGLAKQLLTSGASPNIASPLVEAAVRGNIDIVEAMLNSPGINIEQKDSNGVSAFIHAEARGYKEIVELITHLPLSRDNLND